MRLSVVKIGAEYIRVGREVRHRKFQDHVVTDLKGSGGLNVTYEWLSSPWDEGRIEDYFKRKRSNRRWRILRRIFRLSDKPNHAHTFLLQGAVLLNGSGRDESGDWEWLKRNEIP